MLWKVIVVCVVAKLVEKFVFPLAWVQGESMYPTYHHHDLVLFTRIFCRRALKPGDVVIMKNPYDIDNDTGKPKLLIKRIYSIRWEKKVPTALYILGDNSGNSYDSKNFGFLPISCLYAKAIYSRKQIKEKGQK